MPATSIGLSKLLFLWWPLTELMKQTRQVVCAFKQSILLRCLWFYPKDVLLFKRKHSPYCVPKSDSAESQILVEYLSWNPSSCTVYKMVLVPRLFNQNMLPKSDSAESQFLQFSLDYHLVLSLKYWWCCNYFAKKDVRIEKEFPPPPLLKTCKISSY